MCRIFQGNHAPLETDPCLFNILSWAEENIYCVLKTVEIVCNSVTGKQSSSKYQVTSRKAENWPH